MPVVLVLLGLLAALGLARALLPRVAHAAFVAGGFAQARRRYRLIRWTSLSRRRRAAAQVSIAGAWLAEGRYREGQAALARVDDDRLDPATRAGLLNNRAYAALRLGARGDAARPALAWVREALTLRPDVPGLLHTEGLALQAVGEPEAAVRAFEAMWDQGEPAPRLEAERCADLARAWTELGHPEYAADYQRRARQAAPDAPWSPEPPPASPDPQLDPLLDDAA